MVRIPCASLVLLGCSWIASAQDLPARNAAQIFDEQFKKFDTNADGQLDQEELDGRPFLQRADADGDGVVTREEARAALVKARTLRNRLGQAIQSRPRGQSQHPKGVVRLDDIPYVETDGSKSDLRKLDIYHPERGKDLPVMIYVHGGGWTRGDKKAVGQKVSLFCLEDYVFVSVNYRMLPETKVPAQAQDVAAAVAWVHDHAKDYGGNPDRLFLMGHSAGAHLVSLVATNETLLGNCGKDLSAIKGLIELDTAALDVPRLMQSARGMYPKVFGDDPEIHKLISPYEHVAPGKSIPPFLLVVADNNAGKIEQSNAMAKKLQEAGVRAEVIEAPDKTHGTLNQDLGEADDKITERVKRFLEALARAQNDK
jgi:acetyl esterase/lipase